MASMREYDHGHQQAAVFRSYPLALNGARAPSPKAEGDQCIKCTGNGVITDQPPLGLVFTYLDGDRGCQELHQNLEGCCYSANWAVVGVNKERLSTTGAGYGYGGVSSKNHKNVQVFGETEVRLIKNSQAFSVGDEVYARFPTQEEVQGMIQRKEPVSLIVCRKSIAPSKSIAQLLTNKKGKGPGTGGDEFNFELLEKSLENTIFESTAEIPSDSKDTLLQAWEKQNIPDPVATIAQLERESSYARHRKIGRALKATREGASKLLIFLDP